MTLEYAKAAELGDVVQPTVALLIWAYIALFTQSYVKIAVVQRLRKASFGALSYTDVRYTDPEVARIKYGIVHDSPIALVADRTAGNLLEQLSPFLASTWLRAVLVPGAAASSGRLAWAYLLSRMAYPFAFYAGHPLLQVSTQPGYVIIWGQLADLAVSAGDKPTWWSAAGCEFAIFAIILASGLVIFIQWALLLLKPSNPSQLEASIPADTRSASNAPLPRTPRAGGGGGARKAK